MMKTPDHEISTPENLAAAYGIQEFTRRIPEKFAASPGQLRAALSLRRQAAKRLARTIGISWLKIRGASEKW